MAYDVIFTDPAIADLREIANWITERAGLDVANAYIARIFDRTAKLAEFPMQGAIDPLIMPDMRVLSFERRLRIAYRVLDERVEIYRIIHAARDVSKL